MEIRQQPQPDPSPDPSRASCAPGRCRTWGPPQEAADLTPPSPATMSGARAVAAGWAWPPLFRPGATAGSMWDSARGWSPSDEGAEDPSRSRAPERITPEQ